jgi:cell division protein FtsI/penicillin-binding protein 2
LQTLAAVRVGLERVVSDPRGTGHTTVQSDQVSIAGKTGTAETGGSAGDHAWFAGYAPAEQPRVAFVVVLEHAGDGSSAAGPLARRLAERMDQLGYFPAR